MLCRGIVFPHGPLIWAPFLCVAVVFGFSRAASASGSYFPPVYNLTCNDEGQEVHLTWVNPAQFDSIEIVRNGESIATLPGNAMSYVDPFVTGGTQTPYGVRGFLGGFFRSRWCVTGSLGTLSASSETAAFSQTVTVRIQLDTPVDLQGWSLGFRHHKEKLTLMEVLPGSVIPTINNGSPPDFFDVDIVTDPTCQPRCWGGFTVGVVINFTGAAVLPPGSGYEMHVARYTVEAVGPDCTFVDFSNELGCAPVATVFVINGQSKIPLQLAGIIEIEELLFVRGDANGDGIVDFADAIFILMTMFSPEVVPCEIAADVNGSGVFNIADPVYLLSYLFSGGTSPPPPFPDCGPDSGVDLLPCEVHDACP